jgi:predicted RNase H-like HicB family nuclease
VSKKRSISVKVEKTDTGFSAYSEDCHVYTTGISVPGLMNNFQEGMELYLEEVPEDKSRPVIFEVDFQQFFTYYKVLNARFLADRIGMNYSLLSQYVRGKKKPSEAQAKRILEGIHQIGKELSEISLKLQS